jgi:TPR repeat protein
MLFGAQHSHRPHLIHSGQITGPGDTHMRIVIAFIVAIAAPVAFAQSIGDGFDALGRLDFAAARNIFTTHAERGESAAQIELGFMYAIGEGIPGDKVQAYKWFDVAARSGDRFAGEMRDTLANRMTPEQIAEGKARAEAFKATGANAASSN